MSFINDSEFIEQLTKTVESWPDWMRQGIPPMYDNDYEYLTTLKGRQS